MLVLSLDLACALSCLPASPVGSRVCPQSLTLGQLRHRRPFHVESAQSGSPGEGVRSRQCIWRVGGYAMGIKMRCPFSGMGSGKTDGCPLALQEEGGTAEAKRSPLPAPFPETSQSLPSDNSVIVQTLRPCMAHLS